MILSRTVLSILAAALVSSAAMATPTTAPVTPSPCGMRGGGASVMRFLTLEERLIHRAEVTKAVAGMTNAQMVAYRLQQCEKVASMSTEEKDKFAADLQAKWNALPDAEKIKLLEQALTTRGGRGMGMGRGGMGPGWW